MLPLPTDWDGSACTGAPLYAHHRPERSVLGVNGLALGARVAIECVAVVGD
jgi:enamine deaminase RidA (YjgF/YER057c/UK114 family)